PLGGRAALTARVALATRWPGGGADARAHLARALARRGPVRTARGSATGGAPLARRADPRHRAVRTPPGRRRRASRGRLTRARRGRATPDSGLRASVHQGTGLRTGASDRLRPAGSGGGYSPRQVTPITRA